MKNFIAPIILGIFMTIIGLIMHYVKLPQNVIITLGFLWCVVGVAFLWTLINSIILWKQK